jgi:hypothetical protein
MIQVVSTYHAVDSRFNRKLLLEKYLRLMRLFDC